MGYTVAQVAALVKTTNEKLDRIERLLVGERAIAGSTSTPTAASPVAIPERGEKAARLTCAVHPEHKAGKGFSTTGMAAHRTWCDGVVKAE